MNTNARYANLRRAVATGLGFAVFFSVVAILIYSIAGESAFERKGLTLAETIVYYLLGGLIAGAVVGFLSSLTARYAGAVFVGVIASALATAAVYIVKFGPFWTWDKITWISLLVAALMFGWIGAHMLFKRK